MHQFPPNMRNIAEEIEQDISDVEPLGISDDIHDVLCEIRKMQEDMQSEINEFKQSDAIKTKQESIRYWITTAISIAALIVAIIALLKQ